MTASPLAGEAWRGLLDQVIEVYGIQREVRLLRSDQAVMPMTFGFGRPVILLPKNAEEWSAERRRLVLLHEMAHLLDRRVLQFAENERNTARTLKGIIRKKQRFPRDLFSSLKEAFPCIIAGIRDYAEYIPLDRDLFDLVVIDEASQVSIAQAFPALLRARQVVVFGDRKQFSNVKSAHAKSEINVEWKKRIRDSFVDSAGSDPTHLERVGKFDIKTSILEFFDHTCNFEKRGCSL